MRCSSSCTARRRPHLGMLLSCLLAPRICKMSPRPGSCSEKPCQSPVLPCGILTSTVRLRLEELGENNNIPNLRSFQAAGRQKARGKPKTWRLLRREGRVTLHSPHVSKDTDRAMPDSTCSLASEQFQLGLSFLISALDIPSMAPAPLRYSPANAGFRNLLSNPKELHEVFTSQNALAVEHWCFKVEPVKAFVPPTGAKFRLPEEGSALASTSCASCLLLPPSCSNLSRAQ